MTNPTKIHEQDGYEYYARYDEGADVHEVFLDPECETFVGEADDLNNVKRVAKEHAAEMAAI